MCVRMERGSECGMAQVAECGNCEFWHVSDVNFGCSQFRSDLEVIFWVRGGKLIDKCF